MKQRVLPLLILAISLLLPSAANAQCPLFRVKPLLEQHCPQFTTDTTSLHARLRSENGREYTVNYRALRMEAPRRLVPAHIVRQLQSQVAASMKQARRANHYEVHEEGRDTISYTLSYGNIRTLLQSSSIERKDTIWSTSLVLTADSIHFLTLSTWGARIKK